MQLVLNDEIRASAHTKDLSCPLPPRQNGKFVDRTNQERGRILVDRVVNDANR